MPSTSATRRHRSPTSSWTRATWRTSSPSDFIVSLERPQGYMGARDFHDLDSPIPDDERTLANSNEKAHVRDIRCTTSTERTTPNCARRWTCSSSRRHEAVPGGQGGSADRPFRHHTMLVHESVGTESHARARWPRHASCGGRAGYTGEAGHDATAAAVRRATSKPVSLAARGDLPVPRSFDDLQPLHRGAGRKDRRRQQADHRGQRRQGDRGPRSRLRRHQRLEDPNRRAEALSRVHRRRTDGHATTAVWRPTVPR